MKNYSLYSSGNLLMCGIGNLLMSRMEIAVCSMEKITC